MSNTLKIATDTILDASVVAKWFVEEDGSDRARLYLSAYKDGEFPIVVPTLLFYELGNVLLFKKGTVQQVGRVMEALQDLQMTRVDVGFDSFSPPSRNPRVINPRMERSVFFASAGRKTSQPRLTVADFSCDEATDEESEGFGPRSFKKVYKTAQELGITFYDAAYVTLLQGHSGAEFVTADEKLFHKLRKVYSSVKLL